MKLLIRLDSLVHPRTGIGYYTENLVRTLRDSAPDVQMTGYYHGRLIEHEDLPSILDDVGDRQGSGQGWAARVRPVIRGIPGAYAARQRLLGWRGAQKVRHLGADVYHEPSSIPITFSGPMVLTVHDMSHVRFPQHHPVKRVAFLNRYLPQAVQRARHIITDTEFTRRELCDLFPRAVDKVTAIHLGVDSDFRPRNASETAPVLSKWNLKHGEYLLSAATLEPRKNLTGLVQAYKQLPAGIRQQLPLVLVGGKGWKYREFEKLLAGLDARDGAVILTGRISRTDLTRLMSGARLFAYPSFYEGFGLPIAEARASGVPVLTSDRGAMQEVAGNDAILVDPLSFTAELRSALESDALTVTPYRYSWDETARKTAEIYRLSGKA